MGQLKPSPNLDEADAAILVEGESDREAVLSTAIGMQRDLDAEGIVVIAMGGATNIDKHVRRCGSNGAGLELFGLCDGGEAALFTRVLDAAAVFVCRADLEEELLRALGAEEMLAFIASQGELKRFRTFQKQPAQRGRPLDAHLHRFCGIRAGRKVRYAREIARILSPERVPPPLQALFDHV